MKKDKPDMPRGGKSMALPMGAMAIMMITSILSLRGLPAEARYGIQSGFYYIFAAVAYRCSGYGNGQCGILFLHESWFRHRNSSTGLDFEDINARNCHVAAAYFDGLPEQKIEEIRMENITVTYAENPKCDVPSMSAGVEPCSLKGIWANNVKKLKLKNVSITGQQGEAIVLSGVDELEQ